MFPLNNSLSKEDSKLLWWFYPEAYNETKWCIFAPELLTPYDE